MSRALITTTDGILICRDLEKEKKAAQKNQTTSCIRKDNT